MKDGYKKTELGYIPSEWEIKKINDFANFVGSGVTPRGGQSVYKSEGIPFIRSQNVYPDGLRLDDVVYIDDEQNDKMKRTEFKENDVLLNITGASIGRCTYVPLGFGRGNVNQHVCIVRADSTVNPVYLSMYINSPIVQKQIEALNTGSSREGLNFQQVRGLKICFTEINEQQKIAKILSTVDSQIDDTDKLIEKTKELKKGLMQRLLTKGIGHTEFKITEIGEIPVEWDVKSLLNLSLTKGEYGLGASATEYALGKPRYLRITDIGEDSRLLNNEIRGFEESNYKNFILKEGDIVLARTGNTTGKSYVYSISDGELVYAGFLIRFRINKDLGNENYIKYVLQTKRYWDWIKVMSTRSGQPGINSNEYGEFKIQLPTLDEQNKIANIILSVDTQIEEYENKKVKVEQLKKALMQQLLTGKIRVV